MTASLLWTGLVGHHQPAGCNKWTR